MKNFNKYQFLNDLEEMIQNDLDSGNIELDEDSIQEYIYSVIDNAVIYYADSWSIAYELGDNNFENPITGETCKNITELAYYSLLDYVQGEIDIDSIIFDYQIEKI
jgi:hypothetical protein